MGPLRAHTPRSRSKVAKGVACRMWHCLAMGCASHFHDVICTCISVPNPEAAKSKSRKTHQKAISIYIYICCRVEIPSKNCPFLSWKSVQNFPFFLFLFFKNLLLSAGRMRFFNKKRKKRKKKKNTHTQIFCVDNLSNYVAQHAWTDFQRNLGRIFNSTILLILGLFSLLKKCRNHYFYSVFSQKM